MLATLRQRNFALLWLGGLISLFGDWMLRIALPFYVYDVTGSILATGVMVMVSTVPRVVLGAVAGVFVDRWDRKRTLVIANVLLCLLLLLLLMVRSVEQVWLVFVVAFLEASIAQFIGPAEHALLPHLVPETHLVPANALNALNNNLAMLIGPAIGGMFMASFSLQAVVVLDSLSYLLAAILIWPVSQPPRSVQISDSVAPIPARGLSAVWITVWREWWDGLQLVKTHRTLAAVFLVTAIVAFGEGIFGVVLIPFLQRLGGGAQEFGWLATVRGIGGLMGGLIIARIYAVLSPRRLLATSLLFAGLLGVVMVNVPLLPVAMGSLCVWGIPAMGAQVSCQTLLQRSVADGYQGRVFGAYGTTAALLLLSGQAFTIGVANYVDLGLLLNMYAALYLVGGVALTTILTEPRSTSEVQVEEP